MTIIEVSYEKPRVYNFKNVMYWEPESKRLLTLKKDGNKEAGTILNKSKKFLELNCIQKSGDNYICLPIKNYNKTTYTINPVKWSCNCQGYSIYNKCSHLLAVKQKIYIEANTIL